MSEILRKLLILFLYIIFFPVFVLIFLSVSLAALPLILKEYLTK